MTILAPMQHAAERVAALDPNGADGHGMAGLIAAWYNRDSATAERELNRALQIDSTNGYALPALSSFVAVRHPDSSGALEVRALRHNPWSTLVLYFTAWLPAAHRAMSADTAVLVCGRLRQNAPPMADNCDALRLDRLGRRAEAQALLRRADTTNLEPTVWAWRGLGAALVGDTSLARRLLARAEEESRRRYVREDFVALAYAELGDRDQAFRWAVRAFDSRCSGALWGYQRLMQKFGTDPEFRSRLNAAYFARRVAGESAG